MEFIKFPFVGSVAQSNGRTWHWQLNIMGGSVIAHGEVLDEGPAIAALEEARKQALQDLKAQLAELENA